MNPGAESFQAVLTRPNSSQSWGFRLQGGKDFAQALSIQSVAAGSVAQQCGLKAGDAVLQINNRPSDELEHEVAKREIIMSGDQVVLLVQRGAVTVWKPQVTPLSQMQPAGQPQHAAAPGGGGGGDVYIQKTSLAANKQESQNIGSSHNFTARPFGGFGGGGSRGGGGGGGGYQNPAAGGHGGQQNEADTVPAVVHSQYNSPMGMYSVDNVADTYSSQSKALLADVESLDISDGNNNKEDDKPSSPSVDAPPPALPTGPPPALPTGPPPAPPAGLPTVHLGVQSEDDRPTRSVSPTYLLVQQEASGQKPQVHEAARYTETQDGEEIHYKGYVNPTKQSRSFKFLQEELSHTEGGHQQPHQQPHQQQAQAPGDAAVQGMRSVRAPTGPPANVQTQQAQYMTCKVCGSLCVGVFVKIKGEPMHPECFKCVQCGKNLKNQGHFTVEGQMYCEDHARAAQQAANPGMVGVATYR